MKIHVMIFVIIAFYLFCPAEAYAYIDPNIGGYIFQILFPLLCAVSTILLFCRNGVRKVLAFIRRIFRRDSYTDKKQ